ncbi:MAG: galactokinase family protein [Desulfurococcaceae archaeon]
MANAMNKTKFLIEKFIEHYGNKPEVISSAPGRLDFLNTHQDYKGLPVVSVAINMRTYIALSYSSLGQESKVISLNLCEEGVKCIDRFNAKDPELVPGKWFGNYIRSVFKALRNKSFDVENVNVLIYSEIPIASGLASSAALMVSLLTGLNKLFGYGLSLKDIAELAYHSEHDIMGIPCGRLDQYGSAMGGITLINTKPPFDTETFSNYEWVFVAIDSGIKHSTAEVHPRRISELTNAVKMLIDMQDLPLNVKSRLSYDIYNVEWEAINIDMIEPFLNKIPVIERNRFLFTLKMNYSTKLALELLRKRDVSSMGKIIIDFVERECPECVRYAIRTNDLILALISSIVNYQHVLLRDLYDVSLHELEVIRKTALENGALGVKISGAGLGGAMMALVDSYDIANRIVMKLSDVARNSWIVRVDEGARIEFIT